MLANCFLTLIADIGYKNRGGHYIDSINIKDITCVGDNQRIK